MTSLYSHEIKKITEGTGAKSGFVGFFFPSLRARGLGEEKPVPTYSAIIYKEGDEVRAEDWKGRKIASGQAGVDDASVIQRALDFGGLIYLAPGRYKFIEQQVFIRTDNTKLAGAGIDITILEGGIHLGTDIEGSSAPKTTNIELADLTIDGTNFPDTGSGVSYRYVENAVVRRVKFYAIPFWNIFGNFESGVPKSKSLYLLDCIFDRNNVTRGQQDMTAFNNLEILHVESCTFKNNGVGATFLPYSNIDYVYLENCEFKNIAAYGGILIGFGSPLGSIKTAFVRDIKIINAGTNSIMPSEYAYISGIKMRGSSSQSSVLEVGGQLCEVCDIQAAYYTNIHLLPWGHDGTDYVAGKIVMNSVAADRIELLIKSDSVPDNVKVELHNVITHINYGGNGGFRSPINPNLTAARNIYLYLYECNFEGHLSLYSYEPSTALITYRGMIKRCKAPTLYLGQKVAIEFVDNDFDNVQYSDTYTDVGAIFKKNKNPKTENSGTATFSGDGTKTQFSISHGLVSTPSRVLATPMTKDAAGDFYITKDDTNIYVNYLSAPPSGSNNVKLSWYAEI